MRFHTAGKNPLFPSDIPCLVAMPPKLGSDTNRVYFTPNVNQNPLPVKSVNNVVMDLMPENSWVSKLHYTNLPILHHPFLSGLSFSLTFRDVEGFCDRWSKNGTLQDRTQRKKHQKNIETQSMRSSRGAKTTGRECQGRKKPFRWKPCELQEIRVRCPCSRLPRRTHSPGTTPDSTSPGPLERAEPECLSSRSLPTERTGSHSDGKERKRASRDPHVDT